MRSQKWLVLAAALPLATWAFHMPSPRPASSSAATPRSVATNPRRGEIGMTITSDYTNKLSSHEQQALATGKVPFPSEHLDFRRVWWPIYPVEDLMPDRPTRVELLAEAVVIWRDADKQWRAALDRRYCQQSALGETWYGSAPSGIFVIEGSLHVSCACNGAVSSLQNLLASRHGNTDLDVKCCSCDWSVNRVDTQLNASNDVRCPHRMAPLSEGYVDPEEGRLACAYHGWQFNGDGKCDKIPQASSENAAMSAMASRRSCLTTLPTRQETGLLWIWRDGSPEGVEASEVTPTQAIPQMDDPEYDGYWYMRDLPYSYDVLIENLGDPAHLPFAHNKLISNHKRAGPINMHMETPDDAAKLNLHGSPGYLSKPYAVGAFMGDLPNVRLAFEAPTLLYYKATLVLLHTSSLCIKTNMLRPIFLFLSMPQTDFTGMLGELVERFPVAAPLKMLGRMLVKRETKDPNKEQLVWVAAYIVPTAPGRSRLITRNARNFLTGFGRVPRFKEHLRQHAVLDSDNIILNLQEREYNKIPEQSKFESKVFMPTESDGAIRAFRSWFRKNPPQWAPGVEETRERALAPPNRRQLLDRFNAHTKNCKACRDALRQTQQKRKGSLAASAVLLVVAAILPGGSRAAVAAAAAALAAASASYKLKQQEQQFHFVDYVHAERDV
ncbi:hypothetical protein JKP88DRAFT_263497 [Tribonema minus]|uniref:Rieske domain-containing protein n=1 Tax=Tribonema minus TaxID=303371 RepID=A0A835Z3P3_9STRA|nr:hypothetical protein JKP88DRAFT_263497 [Tribonema minus]